MDNMEVDLQMYTEGGWFVWQSDWNRYDITNETCAEHKLYNYCCTVSDVHNKISHQDITDNIYHFPLYISLFVSKDRPVPHWIWL